MHKNPSLKPLLWNAAAAQACRSANNSPMQKYQMDKFISIEHNKAYYDKASKSAHDRRLYRHCCGCRQWQSCRYIAEKCAQLVVGLGV
jgi:hypothetical protein